MSEYGPNNSETEADRKGRKIIFWIRIVYLGITVISAWFWGWKGFFGALIVAAAITINGLVAEWEDNQPGGFNNTIEKKVDDETTKLRWFHFLLSIFAFAPVLGAFAGTALILIGINKRRKGRWIFIVVGLSGILLSLFIYPSAGLNRMREMSNKAGQQRHLIENTTSDSTKVQAETRPR